MSDNQGITPPHLQGFGSPSAGATRMTLDERLEEILRAVADGSYTPHWGDDRLVLTVPEAITAIKQAMRETMPERKAINIPVGQVHKGGIQSKRTNPRKDGYTFGYNTAIDEIEKGFGLDG